MSLAWSKDAGVEIEGQTKPCLAEIEAASQHGHLCPGLTKHLPIHPTPRGASPWTDKAGYSCRNPHLRGQRFTARLLSQQVDWQAGESSIPARGVCEHPSTQCAHNPLALGVDGLGGRTLIPLQGEGKN